MKILLSCMTCNPHRGSEWAVGWDFAYALAKRHRLFLLTAEEDAEDITRACQDLPKRLLDNMSFHYIRVGFADIQEVKNPLARQVFFDRCLKKWHRKALDTAAALAHDNEIQIVHKVTPCGFRSPGYFWKLDIPSVWGPVTGFGKYPLHLLEEIPFLTKAHYYLKYFVSRYDFLFSPPVVQAANKYSAIISGTHYVRSWFERKYARKTPVMVQSGLTDDFDVADEPRRRDAAEPLNIAWVGSMENRKSLNLVLQGLASPSVNDGNWHLHVIGGGAMLERWKKKAAALRLSEKTTFHGKVERARVFELMKRCHLFSLLSVIDVAPGVLSEAFGCGLPVVCLDTDGFSHVVDETCGRLIRPDSNRQVAADFAGVINELLSDEDSRYGLAKCALEKSRSFMYRHKIEQLELIYEDLVNRRTQSVHSAAREG